MGMPHDDTVNIITMSPSLNLKRTCWRVFSSGYPKNPSLASGMSRPDPSIDGLGVSSEGPISVGGML